MTSKIADRELLIIGLKEACDILRECVRVMSPPDLTHMNNLKGRIVWYRKSGATKKRAVEFLETLGKQE